MAGQNIIRQLCYKLVLCEHLATVGGEGGGPEEPCLLWRTGHDGTGVPGKRVNMVKCGKGGPEAAAAGEQHQVFLIAVTWTHHIG